MPKELLSEWDIHTVPFTLLMGEESALDGEVTSKELFAFTEKTGKLPKTSAVKGGRCFRNQCAKGLPAHARPQFL